MADGVVGLLTYILYGLTKTSACSNPGEIGAPVLAGDQTQGIAVVSSNNCTIGGSTYLQPVTGRWPRTASHSSRPDHST
ncbi:chymotrypsin family serine protease [Micromonospora schwarzwaldensis]|uniref:hypothetical protein n=1 Tax=Micromonospora sp. DSM 45708 TaxID=3111767 RepID=UPI0031D8C6FD